METHVIDQADPDYTYCNRITAQVESAVSVDNMDQETNCWECIREFNDRY